jgi:tetratricopeptide (TPR) repeat protein
MTLLLQIRHDRTRLRAPTAWFIVGRTAECWLDELAHWNTPLEAARIFVIPRASHDRGPIGLFVIGAAPTAGCGTPAAIPYGLVAGRVYLPIDAQLDPAVSDEELTELFDVDHFWHPQAGLFRLAHAGHVRDLVAVPPTAQDEWHGAVPGVTVPMRLTAVERLAELDVAVILRQGQDGIGSQPLDLDTLPPAPGEPLAGIRGTVGRAIERSMAAVVHWLAGLAPTTASAPTWINAVDGWAIATLQNVATANEQARHRELTRLLHLLRDDPDAGLRFAIPFGADDHRGGAPPANTLSSRTVDFSLSGMPGPADAWNIAADMRRKLTDRYRELAAREAGLGRHRRAAYIFATLLHDLGGAARVLEAGGHFREAAAVYEEKLNRRDLAAACLRKGRCWPEALAVYERLQDHEAIGDILVEMERPDAASAAWQRAVEHALKVGDVLTAARILETKLGQVDDAYDRLVAAWPRSRQAGQCLTAAFELTKAHERHADAVRLVAVAADQLHDPGGTVALIDILGSQARTYPSMEVRSDAADQVRMLVAGRLGANVTEEEAGRLVAALGRLAPEDRLLQRDGNRFLALRRQRSAAIAKIVSTTQRPMIAPKPLAELRLPGDEWHALTVGGEQIFAAGYRERELIISRTDWNGAGVDEPVGPAWNSGGPDVRRITITADRITMGRVFVHAMAGDPLPHERRFLAHDRCPEAISVGPHPGLAQETCGFVLGNGETAFVVDADATDGGVLTAYACAGPSFQRTAIARIVLQDLPAAVVSPALPIPMVFHDPDVICGIGHNLCFIRPGTTARFEETPEAIEQIIASPRHTRSRVIVGMARGGFVTWGAAEHASRAPFAADMVSPRIALSRGGTLIAVSADEVEFYSTMNHRLRLITRWRNSGVAPVAVIASRQTNRFAVLSGDGRLVIHDVPGT